MLTVFRCEFLYYQYICEYISYKMNAYRSSIILLIMVQFYRNNLVITFWRKSTIGNDDCKSRLLLFNIEPADLKLDAFTNVAKVHVFAVILVRLYFSFCPKNPTTFHFLNSVSPFYDRIWVHFYLIRIPNQNTRRGIFQHILKQ